MAYCVNCGAQVVENAKYCQKCGHPIGAYGDSTTRRQEYAGKIYKCPNCGEVLKSFEIKCPSCGHELRGVRASSAVKEFALKLEAIESRREYEKPRGLFSMAASLQRISKTDEQKISLIQSFSVPNTKEDMLEFMILATTNVNLRSYDSTNTNITKGEKSINDAWISKIKQVYEKAKRSYGDEAAFLQIQELYVHCKQDIKKAKRKGIIKWGLLFGWVPLIFIVAFLWAGLAGPGAEKNEVARLEAIEQVVYTALENGEYKKALLNADGLYYRPSVRNGNADELERQWDIKRELLIDEILKEAEKNDIYLEYSPASDIDKSIVGGNTEESDQEHSPAPNDGESNKVETTEKTTAEDSEELIEATLPESIKTQKLQSDTTAEEQRDGMTVPTNETSPLHIKNFSFELPTYWEEEGSKIEYLQYYAEKGDKVVMLGIGYPEETDDDYDVSFDGLYTDNENMKKAVASAFDKSDVVSSEVFESLHGVKGILYHFTCQQKNSWLETIDASGYCFCFPSESDRRWFYVYYIETSNVPGNTYKNDYIALISSVKEQKST